MARGKRQEPSSANMPRVVVVLAVPRSGSNPVSQTIGHYLNRVYGHVYLGEYFNLCQRGIDFQGGEINAARAVWSNNHYQQTPVDELKKETAFRFEHLAKSRAKYVFKLFPFLIDDPLMGPTLSKAKVVFLERKNLFEHVLSFLVSQTTGLYYEPEGICVEKKSLRAHPRIFANFLLMFEAFCELQNRMPQAQTVTYESFVTDGPRDFLLRAGFLPEVDTSDLVLPRKQNNESKAELFSNIEDIKFWYKNSPLNDRYKI